MTVVLEVISLLPPPEWSKYIHAHHTRSLGLGFRQALWILPLFFTAAVWPNRSHLKNYLHSDPYFSLLLDSQFHPYWLFKCRNGYRSLKYRVWGTNPYLVDTIYGVLFLFFSLDSSFFEPAFNISAFFSFNLLPINFLIFFFFWVYPKVTVLEMHRWACECCCLSTLLVAEWPFFFLSFLERTNCFVLKVTWQVLLSLSVFPRK